MRTGSSPSATQGAGFDDTPEDFDQSPLVDQEPERDYTPDEDGGGVVHYGPGDRPLCGSESMTADYTDDPARVAGCADCLELVSEDLAVLSPSFGHFPLLFSSNRCPQFRSRTLA